MVLSSPWKDPSPYLSIGIVLVIVSPLIKGYNRRGILTVTEGRKADGE